MTKCIACQNEQPLDFDFEVAFQPIIDAAKQRVWGYESLVRGLYGEGAASVLAQVTETNRYKFDQLCRTKAIESAAERFDRADLMLSINFMPNAVYEPAACIRSTLAAASRTGFDRSRLMFEFTENEQIIDANHIGRIILAYREFGFMTALDDFGAGYAGLGLLARFQPDLIKIDMEVLRGVDDSKPRQAIVRALVTMATDLGIQVLAEGVETADEFKTLTALGIRLFQGYYFGRPHVGFVNSRSPALSPDGANAGVESLARIAAAG